MGRVLRTQDSWARIKQWTLVPSDFCPLHSSSTLVWSHPSTFALGPCNSLPRTTTTRGNGQRNCRAAGGQARCSESAGALLWALRLGPSVQPSGQWVGSRYLGSGGGELGVRRH